MTLKRIILNRRRPDLSPAQFRAHWRDVHGPLLAGLAEYRDHVSRYVQDHPAGPAPFGYAFDYEGITEIWQRRGDVARRFASTTTYAEQVKPDEARFADRTGAIALFAREVARGGEAVGAKLMVLARRDPELGPADFADSVAGWAPSIGAGYAVDLVDAGTVVGLDGSPPAARFDLIVSIWLKPGNTGAALAADFARPGLFAAEGLVAGMFEEIAFFDERVLVGAGA